MTIVVTPEMLRRVAHLWFVQHANSWEIARQLGVKEQQALVLIRLAKERRARETASDESAGLPNVTRETLGSGKP